jgi:hypothetical protein
MTTSPARPDGLALSFNASARFAPQATRFTTRDAFYHLVNVEEHPELLPLWYDHATSRLADAGPTSGARAPQEGDWETQLGVELDRVAAPQAGAASPWRHTSDDLTRRQVLFYYLQFLPTALVDGCWLQCGLKVSSAHTPVGAALTKLYAHHLRVLVADPGRHYVGEYRNAYSRLGSPLEEVSSRSFADRTDIVDSSFALPVFLLSLPQFTRVFDAEILGVNLAWQFLDLPAFGPRLLRDLCATYELSPPGSDLDDADHRALGRTLARTAAIAHLQRTGATAWPRILSGLRAGVNAWNDWMTRTAAAAPVGPPDPRQEMLDLLWRKAPHAKGYHAQKALGDKRIDDHLDPATFDGSKLLDDLAASRWVKPGLSERSGLLRHLVKFGGPMLAVFSPVELQIIQRWIDSLPPKPRDGEPAVAAPRGHAAAVPSVRSPEYVSGRAWTRDQFQLESQHRHADCSTRELFYHLINVEFHPEILPIAERYARDRLERSMAMIVKGERPIPSWRYDPAALEQWVHTKHRQQVDSYRAPNVRPPVTREAFVEASIQLAPIILIDGGWLQGIPSPALIHSEVGRMLFHVLVEEIGEGDETGHHANIYRDLLAAMGEAAPPVESWEFARWSRLRDESFEVPTLWLAISCFPRHFFPEILGLNLAVEIAGIGGPYMEARDTLKQFQLPTLFVDVHNAADNVAAGHSAWAMNSIKRYLDGEAEREGPHALDHSWHRVWSGVRATLPQIGRWRLLAHRVGKRFLGRDPSSVPLIFPS